MVNLLYVLIKMVHIILTVLQFMMMIRALMSWLPIDEDSKFGNFLYAMTEPIVMPIRALFEHFDFMTDIPIDMSFMAAFMLLSILRMLLPVV